MGKIIHEGTRGIIGKDGITNVLLCLFTGFIGEACLGAIRAGFRRRF